MSSVLTRERAVPCAPDGARDDARRAVALAADVDAEFLDQMAQSIVEGRLAWRRFTANARLFP